MSAVCILTPLVIAAWPAFSAAVVAAASSLGYQVVSGVNEEIQVAASNQATTVQLEIARSEVVTNQLARDQRITLTRGGVTVTFSRDVRGKASLCVTGEGYSKQELKALGEELSQTVVQQYVYQKLMDEMHNRGFIVVDQETSEDRSIRLKVRHWEN
jgi:hypothetical protein